MPSFIELIPIFLIVLLLFGAKRLPDIAKSLGKAINEFKKTKNDIVNYTEDVIENDEPEYLKESNSDEYKKVDKKETVK